MLTHVFQKSSSQLRRAAKPINRRRIPITRKGPVLRPVCIWESYWKYSTLYALFIGTNTAACRDTNYSLTLWSRLCLVHVGWYIVSGKKWAFDPKSASSSNPGTPNCAPRVDKNVVPGLNNFKNPWLWTFHNIIKYACGTIFMMWKHIFSRTVFYVWILNRLPITNYNSV